MLGNRFDRHRVVPLASAPAGIAWPLAVLRSGLIVNDHLLGAALPTGSSWPRRDLGVAPFRVAAGPIGRLMITGAGRPG